MTISILLVSDEIIEKSRDKNGGVINEGHESENAQTFRSMSRQ